MQSYKIRDILEKPVFNALFSIDRFEYMIEPNVEWPHRHEYYLIIWFQQGRGTNVIDFSEYEIHADSLFTMLPNQVHNWKHSQDCKGYVLLMEQTLVRQLRLEMVPAVVYPEKEDLKLLDLLFQKLYQNQRENLSREDEQVLFKTISYICTIICASLKTPPEEAKELLKLRSLFNGNLHKQPKVSEYAMQMNMSESKLNQCCKRLTGKTVKQLDLQHRVTEAKRKLLFEKTTVAEIAFALGFDDPSYFCRTFKRSTGLSPNEFRRKSTITF